MAVRKFILITGQSNATEIPRAQDWEDKNSYLALRSPQNAAEQTQQFANGGYNDIYSLPFTFKGGQQVGILGDGGDYGGSLQSPQEAGEWQYTNVLGLASQALRYLTFYDPSPSYFNLTSITGTYPGTGQILAGSTGTTLKTSVRWQRSPDGIVITRQRTGQQHTISADPDITETNAPTNPSQTPPGQTVFDAGATVTITPPMVPAPEVGELFDYEIETVADGASSQLTFKNQFGGLAFSTGLEPNAGQYPAYVSRIYKSDGKTLDSMRINCRGRFMRVGDSITLSNVESSSITFADTGLTASSENADRTDVYHVVRVGDGNTPDTTNVTAANWKAADNRLEITGHRFGDRDAVRFSATSTLPPELSATRTYYTLVPEVSVSQVEVTDAEFDSGVAAPGSAPTQGSPYSWPIAEANIDVTAHGFANGDRVVFDAGSVLPTIDDQTNGLQYYDPPLLAPVVGTVYYVSVVNANAFRLHTAATLTPASVVSWNEAATASSKATLTVSTGSNEVQLVKDALELTDGSYSDAYVSQPVPLPDRTAYVFDLPGVTGNDRPNDGEAVYFAEGSVLPRGYGDNAVTTNKTYYTLRTGTGIELYADAARLLQPASHGFPLATTAWGGSNQITLTGHGLTSGEAVRLLTNSTMPTGAGNLPTTGTTYYVNVVDDDTFELFEDSNLQTQITWSTAPTADSVMQLVVSGTATLRSRSFFSFRQPLQFSAGGGAATITRVDSYSDVYISEDVGGDEVISGLASGRDPSFTQLGVLGPQHQSELRLTHSAVFRGSLTGLQARCIQASGNSASNQGQTRDLHDVFLDPAVVQTVQGPPDWQWTYPSISRVICDPFPAIPADGDKFVIEPQGQVAPFHKWAQWLPWSPFEGKAQYDGPGLVQWVLGTELGTYGIVAGLKAPLTDDMRVQFHTDGKLPGTLSPGKDYYTTNVLAGGTPGTYGFQLKESYDATGFLGYDANDYTDESPAAQAAIVVVDTLGKGNPFPPGFNYPNHHAVPRPYQPFDGAAAMAKEPSCAFHTTLGYRMHEHYGEVFNVAVAAIGQSSVGHKEVRDTDTMLVGHAWYDRMQLKSWSPGEPNNCFSRVLDTLDAAKLAFEREGDTGECVGIFYLQGETDAFRERLADNYEDGMRRLKAALRQAVKDRGLTTLDEDKIPFIHPQIKNYDIYPGTEVVNKAIRTLAEEDGYSQTVEVQDLALIPAPGEVHYSGASMSDLGDRCYQAWRDLQLGEGYSEVEICNMALANLGDKGTITSIRPSDGTRQADLCAQFYELALNGVLQRHAWDFSIRRASPEKLTTDRTEWKYSFRLPSDFVGVLAVLPKEPTDDVSWMGRRTSLEYAIELDASRVRRIYCNQDDIVLRYHAKVTDPRFYTEMFVQTLSWKLATLLAGPLVKGEAGVAAAQRSQQMFEFMLQQAAGFDATKTRERTLEDTTLAQWDRSRGEASDLSEWDRYR